MSNISSTEDGPAPQPFYIDVTGDRTSHRIQTPTGIFSRSQSPAGSDSSEEVILFKGRNKVAKTASRSFNLGGMRTEIRVLEETVMSTPEDGINFDTGCAQNEAQRSQQGARSMSSELIADYISNIREHGEDGVSMPADAYSRRDLGGFSDESDSDEEACQMPKVLVDAVPPNNESVMGDMADGTPAARKLGQEGELPPAAFETDASYFASLEQSHTEELSLHSTISSQDDNDNDIFTAAADRFAQEADDFDFMDWDRPALKRKKGKAAKGKVPIFDISDSELEGKMQAAWKNDRLKKAQRKKERQALRAQGLLGKHANPDDLRVKYPNGMGLDQIADELRTFLLGSQAMYAPPAQPPNVAATLTPSFL